MATSLDGFIADENGGIDWLNELPPPDDPKEDMGYGALIQSIDRLVMGRKTFNQVLSFGSWPYGETPVTVLSHQPPPHILPDGAKVDFTRGSPEDLIGQFKSAGDMHIYLDGGNVVQQFLAAGCIDDIILTQVPVLLGKGISLFKEELPENMWIVKNVTNYSNGFIQTHLIKKESDS
ncbi:MAG: dihydrofolate reductase [Candidatus Marinimicrobia bacterium]|jgi:dihydrofolate reductase|nr:dihydrofolate reductase [Candidatus Neomarinimicrobiota bacterium]MBT3574680.1 dihydrofolate reductase [Candidatus Neomarinimicrobiota bacterium]MBT3681144.1 dihydrofolate reductase [Candidatus Neomarinimicrobiota bacterium]MBT3951699.1 dihydrofolate reductase [Candidatus Neomarinimicrobiota bacterium]MBT4252530.1 dihydrofolate reductase [Candidatus Neomarinimicrobiota bacterium]